MQQTHWRVPVAAGAALLLSSCRVLGPGYMGPIQPPALNVPVGVSDIRALEYGDQLIVAFSIPKLTTEGLPLKSLRAIDLYAGPTEGATDPAAWSKTATRYKVPATVPGPLEQRIPAQPWIGKVVVIRVRSIGPKGRASQWSVAYTMMVDAPIAPPTGVMAEDRKDGAHLTWMGAGPKYRVLRSTGSGMPQPIGDSDKPEFVDASAQFGMTYQYSVLALADDQHQSQPSAPETLQMPAADIFPPEVPADLTATPGVNSIDLAWDIDTEPDFKGFNVFRSVDNGAFEKVASLITAATYNDTGVQPGKSYRYEVSAVDTTNNESQRSAAVTASLQ